MSAFIRMCSIACQVMAPTMCVEVGCGSLLHSVLKISDSLGQECRSLAPSYGAAKFCTSSDAGKTIAKGIANEK